MDTKGVGEPRKRKDDPLIPNWIAVSALILTAIVVFVSLFLNRPARTEKERRGPNMQVIYQPDPARGESVQGGQLVISGRTAAKSAEEIVAKKVSQFAASRRKLAHALALKHGESVPTDVEKFFDAVESGDWAEIQRQFEPLAKRSGQYEGSKADPSLNACWSAVLDAFGVAEQANEWPAQALIDYGNAILDSLEPGMVYVGGTDSGRWIPALLNDTAAGDQHIVITQNALADSRYLEYVELQFGDRFTALTGDDSAKAFQDYVTDATKRLQHDTEFPNEPKQIQHGENVSMKDGRVEVGGQVAVMAINERLLTALMDKNPNLAFGLQESTPFSGTYSNAAPRGGVMQLRAGDSEVFTKDVADASASYWRTKSQEAKAYAADPKGDAVLKTYSHEAVSAANLLAARNFPAQAEETYRLSMALWPGNPESVGRLADFLHQNGRGQEATTILSEFARQFPAQRKDLDRVSAFWRKNQAATQP